MMFFLEIIFLKVASYVPVWNIIYIVFHCFRYDEYPNFSLVKGTDPASDPSLFSQRCRLGGLKYAYKIKF